MAKQKMKMLKCVNKKCRKFLKFIITNESVPRLGVGDSLTLGNFAMWFDNLPHVYEITIKRCDVAEFVEEITDDNL